MICTSVTTLPKTHVPNVRKADISVIRQEATKGVVVDQMKNTEQIRQQMTNKNQTNESNSSRSLGMYTGPVNGRKQDTSSSSNVSITSTSFYDSSLNNFGKVYTENSNRRIDLDRSADKSSLTSNSTITTDTNKNEQVNRLVKPMTCLDDGKELVLNPEGSGNTAGCLMLKDLVVDVELYDMLYSSTPRMKGHSGKTPLKNTVAVYVIGNDGVSSELRSIDGIIDCITMLVFAEGSEKGYFGKDVEGSYYMSVKNKLLGFDREWKLKGILSPQLCQLVFNCSDLSKWHNKWNSMISTHSETLKTKVNCFEGR